MIGGDISRRRDRRHPPPRPGSVACDPEGATFRVPSWRRDIECDADLSRKSPIHGLTLSDTAPFALAVPAWTTPLPATSSAPANCSLKMGFSEVMHYSYLSAAELDAWDSRTPKPAWCCPNREPGLRRDARLPPAATRSPSANMARQMESVALFELGRVFLPGNDGTSARRRASDGTSGPGRCRLDRKRAVRTKRPPCGSKAPSNASWRTSAPDAWSSPRPHPGCQPGWSAAVKLNNREIGAIGLSRHPPPRPARHRPHRRGRDARRAALGEPPPDQVREARARLPVCPRDLARIAPADLPQGDLPPPSAGGPRDARGPAPLRRLQRKGDPRRETQPRLHLEFRAPDRTLTDDEVNAAMAKLTAFPPKNSRSKSARPNPPSATPRKAWRSPRAGSVRQGGLKGRFKNRLRSFRAARAACIAAGLAGLPVSLEHRRNLLRRGAVQNACAFSSVIPDMANAQSMDSFLKSLRSCSDSSSHFLNPSHRHPKLQAPPQSRSHCTP